MEYNIYNGAIKVFENELFYQLENKNAYFRYDYNYFVIKAIPELCELEEAINLMKIKKINEVLHLHFPNNVEISENIKNYLEKNGFSVNKSNVYKINSNEFKKSFTSGLHIEIIKDDNYKDYAILRYENDLFYGEKFANQNKEYIKNEKFAQAETFEFYVAYKNNIPIGTLIVIRNEKYLEIDSFIVKDSYRKQGIGTTLQSLVMENYPNKDIILVTNAYDTPKEMYEKQGYQLIEFTYQALKID